jgi:nicotinamidase-related amidase
MDDRGWEDLLLTLGERIAARHTALLVVDMQNDFCGTGGYIERVVKKDSSQCSKVADPVAELLTVARKTGVLVVWLRANYDPSGLPVNMRARLIEHGVTEGCCVPGTWGYNWYGPQPAANEPVIDKRCYDGFVGTCLHTELRTHGIRTIVFAGVQTNICVEATLRHAHALGYYCVIAEDCVASHTPPAHDVTLSTVRFLLGDVVPRERLQSIWQAAANTVSVPRGDG